VGFMKGQVALTDFSPNPSGFLFASSISGPNSHYSIHHWHYTLSNSNNKQKIKRTASTMIHFEDLSLQYSDMLKIYQDVALHNSNVFSYRMPYWVLDVNTNNFGTSLLILLQKLHSVGLCSPVPIERVYQKLKTAKNHYFMLHIMSCTFYSISTFEEFCSILFWGAEHLDFVYLYA
jgi:hypothetical protein